MQLKKLIKFNALVLVILLTGQIWAQEQGNAAKKPWSDRDASISIWGGYTPLVGADGVGEIDSLCTEFKKVDGFTCSSQVHGFAGGLDIWGGSLFQLGLAMQYMQFASLDVAGETDVEVPGDLPGQTTTKTVKTDVEMISHFMPVMAQIRFYPQYFYVGVGLGMAFNLTQYDATFQGNKASGTSYKKPNGFVAQISVGLSLPVSKEVSFDIFAKGTMISTFATPAALRSGTINEWETVSAYSLTPGIAVTMHL